MSLRVSGVALVAAIVAVSGPAAAASSHTVEITAPQDGATVEGTVLLRARTSGSIASVEFAWAREPTGPWTVIGAGLPNADRTVWAFQWDSDGIDGPVVVRAAASDGSTVATDAVDLVLENRPDVSVTVSPDPFSPNGDRRRDATVIRVVTDEPGEAVIEVIDADGTVRRVWRQPIADEITIEWNGQGEGNPLPDGRYRVRAVVTDGAGMVGRASEPVVIDTRAPRLRWLEVTPEPLGDQDRVRFRFRALDRGPIDLALRVSDRTGRVADVERTVTPGERTIGWRPRYATGGRLFPGQYGATLAGRDEAGNRARSSTRPWRVHRDVPARVFTRLPEAGRRVALTIDDCFREDAWRSILRRLRAADVDATFFCTGGAAARARELIRRTVREGHVFASHTWDHAELRGHDVSYTSSRIARDAALSWRVARYTTAPYFRPPFGAWDSRVVAGAGAASHPRVIMWDVDTRDWTLPGSATIARRAVGPARPGSIILLHTLQQTARALPSIIAGLRRKGLRPVTIAELFDAAGYRSG